MRRLESARMFLRYGLKHRRKELGRQLLERTKRFLAWMKEIGWPSLLALCGVFYLFKVPYDFAFHAKEEYLIYDYIENTFCDAVVISAMFHRFYSINEEIKSTRLPELRKASRAAIFEVAVTGISSVPFELIPSLFGLSTFAIFGLRALRVLWFRRTVAAVAVLYENKILSKASFDVSTGLVVMLSWMHFGACILFLFHRFDPHSDSILFQCLFPICGTLSQHALNNGPWTFENARTAYITCAYYVLTTFMSIGYGDLFGLNSKEKVLAVCLHFGNLISYSMILVRKCYGLFARCAGDSLPILQLRPIRTSFDGDACRFASCR